MSNIRLWRAATTAISGVVTTVAQSFTGVKTFVSGINFGQTANLTYYETGTFTTTISAGTSNFSSVTYSSQVGEYTRIGNVVTFVIRVTWTNASGGTGNLRVGGLPHAAKVTVTQFAVQTDNIDTPATPVGITGSMGAGDTFMTLVASRDGASSTSFDASLNTGAATRSVFVSGSYLV